MSATNTIKNAAVPVQSDTDELSRTGIALYVGVSGNVKVVTTGGDTVTLVGLVAGVWHPIQCKQVFSTGTTATSLLIGW